MFHPRLAPFPPQYERGYNVIAYLPEQHARRVERLNQLRIGAGGILPMILLGTE